MPEYHNYQEFIFAMILYVENKDRSILKDYKIKRLMDLIVSREEKDVFDTYDEYYEDVDEKLKEIDKNFFEGIYGDFESAFQEYGIMGYEDLDEYKDIVNFI